MMAGVNVKMGVSGAGEFKQHMNDCAESVKTLEEALRLNNAQLKETGENEVYFQNALALLKKQVEEQTGVVNAARQALSAMKQNGVDPTSAAYQKMQQKALSAETTLSGIRTKLNETEKNYENFKNGADDLNDSLKDIGKGVAWDNVAKGIQGITDKLRSGAQAAINFGKRLLNSAKSSTQWADSLLTESTKTGIDVETLQRMEKVSDFIDTDVEAIINAKKRMSKAVTTEGGKKTLEETLGLKLEGNNPDDLFWEVGEALLNMGDAFDQEAAAQKMFGRSWDELLPLFKAGRTEYEKMLAEQTVLTEEQVQKLGDADDAMKKVEQQIQDLKNQLWSEYIDKITGLMDWVLKNKDAVYDALKIIAAGFGLLKLGETAANMMQFVNGLNQLKTFGGGGNAVNIAQQAAKQAAGGAGAGASGAGAGTAAGTGGIGASGFLGIGGVAAILAGFKWASDQRNYHSEQVRGTEANLAARTAGAEAVLAEYIRAQAAMNELDWSATEADVIDIQNRIDTAYQKLQEMEGGQEALQAYSDWRQEHSYGNYDWEMPEYLEKVNELVEELNGNGESQRQSNSEMTEAAAGMKTLPEQIKWAVQSGLSNMKVIMDGESVGRVVTPAVNQNLGALVGAIGR